MAPLSIDGAFKMQMLSFSNIFGPRPAQARFRCESGYGRKIFEFVRELAGLAGLLGWLGVLFYLIALFAASPA